MSTGIPQSISLPLLAIVAVIVAGRFILLRSSQTDRWVNAALSWALLCCLLREPVIQNAFSSLFGRELSSPLYRVSEAAVIPCAGALFLVGLSWLGVSSTPRIIRPVNLLVAVSAVTTLALLLLAPSGGVSHDVHSGWAVLAYTYGPVVGLCAVLLHDVLIYFASVILGFTGIRELRYRLRRRELAICAAIASISLCALIQSVAIAVGTMIAATGRHSAYVVALAAGDRFTPAIFTYLGGAVAAAPLVRRLLQHAQMDRYSRVRRRLQPLWADLTAACSEIVYLSPREVAANEPRFRLHRMVVEIRDCMLILSRYASQDEVSTGEESHGSSAQYANRLALMWQAKVTGCSPSNDVSAQQSVANSLVEDADELWQVARHWPQAKALARRLADTAQPSL